jgi:AcrR family transcriptional regulator
MAMTRQKSAAPRRQRRTPSDIRARILRAAADEFKARGPAGATTAAIARHAEVTEAQLFRYFESKAALFREAVFAPLDRNFAEFNVHLLNGAEVAGDHARQTARYIRELQQFIGDRSGLLMSLIVAQTYAPGGAATSERIGSLKDYFDRGAAVMASRVGPDAAVDPQLMVRISFAAVLGAVLFRDWLFPAGLAGADEIEAATIRFVLDGINANEQATMPKMVPARGIEPLTP